MTRTFRAYGQHRLQREDRDWIYGQLAHEEGGVGEGYCLGYIFTYILWHSTCMWMTSYYSIGLVYSQVCSSMPLDDNVLPTIAKKTNY